MVDELAAVPEGIAEKGPDFERRIGEHSGVRNRPEPAEVERADEDTLIGDLDDKGHGSQVFVAAGDEIPAGLRGLPRRAARPAPSRKR